MRVLICGGRTYNDIQAVYKCLDDIHAQTPGGISIIIEGGARGADTIGFYWAKSRKVKNIRFPAKWEIHGKAAGPIRNLQMIEEGRPDIVVAFPGGPGTANMIAQAKQHNIKVILP